MWGESMDVNRSACLSILMLRTETLARPESGAFPIKRMRASFGCRRLFNELLFIDQTYRGRSRLAEIGEL